MSAQNIDHGLQRQRWCVSRRVRQSRPATLTWQTALRPLGAALPARRALARRTAARQWQVQVTLPLCPNSDRRKRTINDLRRAPG
jgi:hypothetical protein